MLTFVLYLVLQKNINRTKGNRKTCHAKLKMKHLEYEHCRHVQKAQEELLNKTLDEFHEIHTNVFNQPDNVGFG